MVRTVALLTGVAALGLASMGAPAEAQVYYQPYLAPLFAPAPTPYGYPVPSGVLQPNEELGTSPSFVISTNPYAPGVAVVPRCQYPDGWNITDFSRDVNGIPNGIEHTCHTIVPVRVAAPARPARVHHTHY